MLDARVVRVALVAVAEGFAWIDEIHSWRVFSPGLEHPDAVAHLCGTVGRGWILLGDRHRRRRRIDLLAQHGARQSTAGPAPVVGAGLLAMFEGAVGHPAGLGLPEVFAFVLPRERAIAPERTSVKPGLR